MMKSQQLLIAIGVITLIAIATFATPYMVCASFAYLCMLGGIYYRTLKNLHVCLMTSAIATDLALVLTLEIQRNAIKTAISMTLSPLQQAHIAASMLATVFYLPTIYFGWKRYQGLLGPTGRSWHIRCGLTAFVFRTLGFILMFSLLNHVRPQ